MCSNFNILSCWAVVPAVPRLPRIPRHLGGCTRVVGVLQISQNLAVPHQMSKGCSARSECSRCLRHLTPLWNNIKLLFISTSKKYRSALQVRCCKFCNLLQFVLLTCIVCFLFVVFPVLQFKLTLVEGLLLSFLYIHTCIIFKR